MHMVIQLILTLLAAAFGFVLGFGAVALFFFVLHIDTGIGGGLIALLIGSISGIAAAASTLNRTMGK